MSCEVQVAEVLRISGQRRTDARLLVLSILNHASDHIMANEVVERSRLISPHMSPSTIYRTLGSLRDAGVVSESLMPGGETRYEWSDESSGHHHLVCKECGKTTDLGGEYFGDLGEKLVSDHGFALNMSHVVLQGICSNCKDL